MYSNACVYKYVYEQHPSPQGRMNHPATHISWNDALAFCRWSTTGGRSVMVPAIGLDETVMPDIAIVNSDLCI